MLRKQCTEVSRINEYRELVTPHPAGSLLVIIGNSEPTAFIIHEAVKRDLPFRAEIEIQFLRHCQDGSILHTKLRMGVIRDTVDSLVIPAILFTTPYQGLKVKFSYVSTDPAGKKVFFHKADQTFDILSEYSDKASYPQTFFIRIF